MAFLSSMIKSRASGRRPLLMYKWWEDCSFQAGLSPWTRHFTFLSLLSQMRSIPAPQSGASGISNHRLWSLGRAIPRVSPGLG